MPSVDWDTVLSDAVDAAKSALGATWDTVETSATQNIQTIVDTAGYVSLHQDELSEPERRLLLDNQQLALKNVLLGYQAIGIVAAEQAVEAVWGVVQTALTSVLKV